MIFDRLNTFCLATALNTGGAGSYLLGDQIDLQDLRDVGLDELWLNILMETTATSGGSATGSFSLVSDDAAAINVSTGTYHITSPVFAVAAMTAGTMLLQTRLPLGAGKPYERYLGIVQTTAVAAFTAGKISAFLTREPSSWKAYPNAIQ